METATRTIVTFVAGFVGSVLVADRVDGHPVTELLRPASPRPAPTSAKCRHCGLPSRLYAYVHLLTGRWLPCTDGYDHEPESP